MTKPSSPHSSTPDQKFDGRQDAVAAVLITSLFIIALLSMGVWQSMLSALCTKAMYGAGWTCFSLWLPTVILATPFRVSGAGKARVFIHGAASTLAWMWFGLAIYPADLFSRADLLWTAYLTCAIAIVAWRFFLLRRTLKQLSFRALQAQPEPSGLLFFATGKRPSLPADSRGAFASRALGFVAGIRARSSVMATHRVVWGHTGYSAIIHAEAMRATDQRVLDLKLALANDRKRETLHPCALDAALALRCEIRIATAPAQPIDFEVHLRRAFLVLEPLALAEVVHSNGEWHTPFVDAISLLERSIDSDKAFSTRLSGLLGATLETISSVDLAALAREGHPLEQSAILHLAAAATLAREGLFRPAGGLLQRWLNSHDPSSSSMQPAGTIAFAEQCRRVAHSLASEIERAAFNKAAARPHGAPSLSEADTRVQAGRQGASQRLGSDGLHPAHANEGELRTKTLPSTHAVLPPPRRAREIGMGAFTLVIALLLWLFGAVLIWRQPWTDRIQVVYDVPLGGPFGFGADIDAACVSVPTSTIVISDPNTGVQTVELDSLRVSNEGGAGTPIDGHVSFLGSDSSGAVFAIFSDATTDSACLSVRSANAEWSARIAAADPSVRDIQGSDVQAVLRGLAEPLFLLREPLPRLLRYDAESRTLRLVANADGIEIEGNFVDASSGTTETGDKSALLLTDNHGGHAYAITQSTPSAPLRVIDLGSPTLIADERLVALAGSDEGAAIAVTSLGAAWALRPSHDAHWQRLRAGDQQLKLDKVDMALVTSNGGRLWILRDGVLRTRSLPSGESPVAPEGWTSIGIDEETRPNIAGRSMLVEGVAESIWLATPAKDDKATGAVRPITLSSGELLVGASLLLSNERLLDVDSSHDRLVLCIERKLTDKESNYELRLEQVHQRAPAPARTLVRATKIGATDDPPSLGGGILALGDSAAGGTRVVFTDGRTIRFDPKRDTLLNALDGDTQVSVQLPAVKGAIDALLTTNGATDELLVLDQSGTVDVMPIALKTLRRTIVDPSEGPDAAVIQTARVGISSATGITLFGRNSMWSFSTQNAADFWTDQTPLLGDGVDHMIGTLSAAGIPTAAWTQGKNNALSLWTNGSSIKTELQNITELHPALNTAVTARDASGSVWSCDVDGKAVKHLSPVSAGPSAITSAGIRDGFVDFLSTDSLHSFSRRDGTWTKSQQIPKEQFQMHAISAGAIRTVALIPQDRGISLVVPAAADATQLGPVGGAPGVQLTGAVPMATGVVGVDDGKALHWVGINGGEDSIAYRAVDGINLFSIQSAAARDGALYLLGKSGDNPAASSRIVRYPIERGRSVATPLTVAGLTEMEIGSGDVFASSATAVSRFDRATLELLSSCDFTGAPEFLLGRIEGNYAAVSVAGGVERLTETAFRATAVGRPTGPLSQAAPRSAPAVERVPLLRPSNGPGVGEPIAIDKAVTWDGRLILFTDGAAWERTDSALSPFQSRLGIASIPEDILIGPQFGGAPWVRAEGVWQQLSVGAEVRGGIGWINGERIECDAQTGAVSLGGKIPAAFSEQAKPMNAPLRVEDLTNGKVLLVGTDGASIFDWTNQTLTRGEPWSADLRPTAGVLSAANGQKFIQTDSGRVYQYTSGGLARQFAGFAVTDVLPDSGLARKASSGQLISMTGDLTANQPSAVPSAPVVKAIGATAHLGTLVRVFENRSVDVFDPKTLKNTTLPVVADAVASVQGDLCFLDGSAGAIQNHTRSLRWPATNWVVGPRSIAFANGRGELGVTDTAGAPIEAPRYLPIPGDVIGNIPASSVALCRVDADRHALFDLVHGRVLVDNMKGVDPRITANGVLALAPDGGSILLHHPNGSSISSGRFFKIVVASSGETASIVGLSERDAGFIAHELDPQTLERVRELAIRRPRVLPIVSPVSRDETRIVPLGGGSQLLIGDAGMVLDDGMSLRVGPNPFGTADLTIRVNARELRATNRSGHYGRLLRLGTMGWDFAPEPSIIRVGKPSSLNNMQWWNEYEVITPIASGIVATSLGTLDCRSGWITEERPINLEVTPTGIVLRCSDPTRNIELLSIPRQNPAPRFSAPISVENDGCLSCVIAGDSVRLGVPTRGQPLDCHRVMSFAPVHAGGLAWIDLRNQLWGWKIGDAHATPMPHSAPVLKFEFDSDGAVYAQTRLKPLEISLARQGGAALVVKPAAPVGPMFIDFTLREGRLGNISWKTTIDSAGASTAWALHPLQHVGAVPINPTAQGFDCFSPSGLASVAGSPVVLFGPPTLKLHAPVGPNGIDWSNATAGAATTPPPAPRALQTELQQPQGNWVTRENAIALELGGTRFPFVPAFARFSCHVAISATAVVDSKTNTPQVVTATGDGSDLVAWQPGNANLMFVRNIQLPVGAHVKELWPSGDSSAFVAEVEVAGETKQLIWKGDAWAPYAAPRFVSSGAKNWGWDGDRTFDLGDQRYALLAGPTPCFACDRVERTSDGTDSLVVTSQGAVRYRGIGGQWYELDKNRMPIACAPPAARPTVEAQEYISIETRAALGERAPSCFLLDGDSKHFVAMRIEDGLVPCLDTWPATKPLHARSSDEAVLVCATGDFERVIQWSAPGQIALSQPRARSESPVFAGFDPLQADDTIKLLPTGELTVNGKSLGKPTAQGFPALNATLAQPLGVDRKNNRVLVYTVGDRLLATTESNPLATFTELREAPRVDSIHRSTQAGKSELQVTQGEQVFAINPETFAFTPTTSGATNEPLLLTNDQRSLAPSRLAGGMLELRSAVDEPKLQLNFSKNAAGRVDLAHTSANRMMSGASEFTTASLRWEATYARTQSGNYALVRVEPRSEKLLLPSVQSYAGGLFATRGSDGTWTLRLGATASATAWPLESFLGGDRTFVHASDALTEIAPTWRRTLAAATGEVTGRWIDDRTAGLATTTAYRADDRIIYDRAAWELAGSDGAKRLVSDEPVPGPCRLSKLDPKAWSVDLESAGAACDMSYRGAKLGLNGGALPMDLAVTVAEGSTGPMLVDRFGLEQDAVAPTTDSTWSMHDQAIRATIAFIPASRALGSPSSEGITPIISDEVSPKAIRLALPTEIDGALTVTEPETLLDTWSLGSRLSANIFTDQRVQLTQTLANGGKYEYQPLPMSKLCKAGRLPFDSPIEMFLAKRPKQTTPSVCIRMELGWEWYAIGGAGLAAEISATAPRREPAPFDAQLKQAWLASSDLAIEPGVSGHCEAQAGEPIIWYPLAERLFLVGTKRMIWVELNSRWSGTPLN